MKEEGVCAAACVLDSTDEAPALKETVADMIDLFSVGQLYTTVEYTRCEVVRSITVGGGPGPRSRVRGQPRRHQIFLDERPVEPGTVEIDGGVDS